MGRHICTFNVRGIPVDWDFVNEELYGDFLDWDLSSDSDSSSSYLDSIEITMEVPR